MLECVVNVSEGRRAGLVDELAAAARLAGPRARSPVLDLHADADHNRSVFTLAGPDVEEAARALARAAVAALDLRAHTGVHPRFGVVDVVPFVPLDRVARAAGTAEAVAGMAEAVAARDRFAAWAGDELALPCFLYGPERSLPELRRNAFGSLAPDTGPSTPHPTAGACAVGARPHLVAYNIWLNSHDLAVAERLAAAVRSPAVRALGFPVQGGVQVSMNLVDPLVVGPATAYDAVRARAAEEHITIRRAELVGLVPDAVLAAIPESRWPELDLGADRTIEARLLAGGIS